MVRNGLWWWFDVVKLWTHWATSSQLTSVRLPRHDGGTSIEGEPLGRAQRGGPFVFDPFDLYTAGRVTSPNVTVLGALGSGKSTVVKMMVSRGLARQRRAVILDPKSEYRDLARAFDGSVVALGSDAWCNPFTGEPVADLGFLVSLLATTRNAPLDDVERAQLEQLWLDSNAASTARPMTTLFDQLRRHDDESSRSLAATVRRFVNGDLAGVLDGDGEPRVLSGAVVVLDMSRWWLSDSVAVLALIAWRIAETALGSSSQRGYIVIDEAWALLQNEFATRWLQGSWKLARSRGIAHVAVVHRLGDTEGASSAVAARAKGLLKDADNFVILRHLEGDALALRDELGLVALEVSYLPQLPRGVGLVRYGPARSIVEFQPTEADRAIIDTDQAMRG